MTIRLEDSSSSEISNTFQVIGRNEDSLTRGIAWVLRCSPGLLAAFVERALGYRVTCDSVTLRLHAYERGCGITDLEIFSPSFHIVVEAKAGWALPTLDQLERYRQRRAFQGDAEGLRILLTLSECGPHVAGVRLPDSLDGVPLRHLSWNNLANLARQAAALATQAEKRLLRELADHLEDSMTQRRDSGLVYVVSLGSGHIDGSSMTWRQVVTEHRRYFHPVGERYPSSPVTNIAFRYDGQLQSLHHVDDFEVIHDLSVAAPGIPPTPRAPHFLYHLGPAITPKPLRAGPSIKRSGRVWCAFDTLFTSETLSDALAETKRRTARSEI